MAASDYIILTLALIGVLDLNIERYTGQGIIGHAADWFKKEA